MLQIALGLGDTCLVNESHGVIGYDIEDLLKFSPRFVETALISERSRMGVEQLRIARVESLRFVKITLALSQSPRCRTSFAITTLI